METGELFITEDIVELLNNGLCQCHNRLIQKKRGVKCVMTEQERFTVKTQNELSKERYLPNQSSTTTPSE